MQENMKKNYTTPALHLFQINVGTSIAQLISVSVAGESINVDNTTNGNASDALVKGQGDNYNVWDDDWSKY